MNGPAHPPTPSGSLPPPPPERWSATPVVRISRRNLWRAGIAGVALFGLGFWLVLSGLPRLLRSPDGASTPAAATRTSGDTRRIQATLYYLAEDGSELVPGAQEVLYGATPSEQARRIVEAEVAAPADGRKSPIPAGTTVRSVFVTPNGHAYVDLGGAVAAGHPGGSLNEALTVYAIVNAVTVNLPSVTAVQLLVEGRQVDTLAGHIDLRYPIGKALDWIRKGT